MQQTTKQTYQLFWRHSLRYKGTGFFMALTLIGGVLTSVTRPVFYKQFFDVLTVSTPAASVVSTLTHIIVIILMLAGLEWVWFRFATYLNSRFESWIMRDIANDAFDYLERHSYNFFVNRFVGSVVRKFNRLVDAYEGVVDRFYWDILPLMVRIAAIVVILATRSITIALILLGWVLLYVAANYFITLVKLKYDKAAAAADTATTAQLADSTANNVTIKLFTALRGEHNAFKKVTDVQMKARLAAWDMSMMIEAVQSVLMIILEFSIFYFAIRLWNRGLLTVGDFVLIQTYVVQLFSRLWDFGRVFRQLFRHLADSEEMVEILNTPHEITDKSGAGVLAVPKGEIEFRTVNFNYHVGRRVINDFSLTVHPGEKVGLVGPSGVGKSTIVGLFFRLFEVTDGGIYIDGVNIADVTQDSLRKNIALVPQDPVLFHRTLMENIRYGRQDATDEEVMEAARLAHCDEFVEKIPQKYNAFVGEKGVKLSGGERQRVAIARAILKNAPILVLDEATSSLDSHSEAVIKDALETLMKGKTSIVIAHRLSTIMRMDRIIVIKDGRVEETGTHAELLTNEGGLYQGLWELQAGGFIA